MLYLGDAPKVAISRERWVKNSTMILKLSKAKTRIQYFSPNLAQLTLTVKTKRDNVIIHVIT